MFSVSMSGAGEEQEKINVILKKFGKTSSGTITIHTFNQVEVYFTKSNT